MKVVSRFSEARAAAAGRVALVPTMGFLHEGHLSLLDLARRDADTLVMSLFVNPLQFDQPDDLQRYPRDLDRDLRLAGEAGVDVVFAPPVEEMYPEEPQTRVVVRRVADPLEGEARPGHFEGVATVVTKLLGGLRPDAAFFGRKDAQQLAVIRRLVHDLSLPVEVKEGSTVRERDGLALSSRNVLVPDREAALGLQRGLEKAAAAVEAGERRGPLLEDLVRSAAGAAELEYVALVDRHSVERLEVLDRPAFLAVAGRVGDVRLIDNITIEPEGDGFAVDRGRRLTGESVLYGTVS